MPGRPTVRSSLDQPGASMTFASGRGLSAPALYRPRRAPWSVVPTRVQPCSSTRRQPMGVLQPAGRLQRTDVLDVYSAGPLRGLWSQLFRP
jgi:hypothetical protein